MLLFAATVFEEAACSRPLLFLLPEEEDGNDSLATDGSGEDENLKSFCFGMAKWYNSSRTTKTTFQESINRNSIGRVAYYFSELIHLLADHHYCGCCQLILDTTNFVDIMRSSLRCCLPVEFEFRNVSARLAPHEAADAGGTHFHILALN